MRKRRLRSHRVAVIDASAARRRLNVQILVAIVGPVIRIIPEVGGRIGSAHLFRVACSKKKKKKIFIELYQYEIILMILICYLVVEVGLQDQDRLLRQDPHRRDRKDG